MYAPYAGAAGMLPYTNGKSAMGSTGASQEKGNEADPILFMFRYIDDVLSLNNSRLGDFVHRVYPIELEMKDTCCHIQMESPQWED
jgi:hypothetical protein